MKYLFYRTDKRVACGLSDRRSSLCGLLAEARFLGRAAVLPLFELSVAHNYKRTVPLSDLTEYFNFDLIKAEVPVFTQAQIDQTGMKSTLTVSEDVATEDLLLCSEQLIVREWTDDNFYTSHEHLRPLASRYHGTGMGPGPGMFLPTARTRELGDRILEQLDQPFVGIHLRRRDRLSLVPRLKELTSPSNVWRSLIQRSLENSVVYFASDEQSPSYYQELAALLNIRRWVDFKADIPNYYRENNYQLFALEMYIVDRAKAGFRTFQDATPFYCLNDTDQRSFSLTDLSMHGG